MEICISEKCSAYLICFIFKTIAYLDDTSVKYTNTLLISSPAIDAFSMNWNNLHAYAFPSIILISSVLNKIRQSQCRIVLIAPNWPHHARFSAVLQLLVSEPVRLPLFPNLLTQAKGRFQHQNLPVLNLHTWELSSNQLEKKNFRRTLQILSPI